MEGRKVLKRLDEEGWNVEVEERVRMVLRKEKERGGGGGRNSPRKGQGKKGEKGGNTSSR